MANLKQLMGMDASTLQELGMRSGLTFPPGMKKSAMVSQLSQAAASGWMEQNQELMSETPEDFDDVSGYSGTSQMLSDAAHAAQMISNAGFGNTFHQAMGSGAAKHLSVLESYLGQIGASPEDVWMHMPKMNPDEQTRPFNFLKSYMRDTLLGHQDIMPEIKGHYAGDIMGEYATPNGNVGEVYESLASMYLNRDAYDSAPHYSRDLAGVSRMLESRMSSGFAEVAFTTATGGKASYMNALPQIGDPSIASHVAHPRVPLGRDGFPMDAPIPRVGGGGNYSLIATLTGRPDVKGSASEAAYKRVSSAVAGLARTYSGDTGMNPYREQTSERDMIMDSASRYADLEDVRSGYANMDEPSYNSSTIRQIIENDYDKMESVAQPTFDPAAGARGQSQTNSGPTDFVMMPGTGFQAEFGAPTSRQPRQQPSSASPQPEFNGDLDKDPVTYHRNVKQGTDEWLKMRENYDITGSQVGTLLGNGSYTTMQKKIAEMEGLYPTSRDANSPFAQQMFARGHASEAAARPRVESEYGVKIEEVGAITNADYPNMMYSPDGLIGDDALWEHKNPNVTKKFADLKGGEHQDYMDQIQLGMHLSGRSRTLFSQTVGNNTQSEWIDADPTWYERNKDQLNSVSGRRSAVRDYIAGNQKTYDDAMSHAESDKERDLLTRRFRLGAQKVAKGDASEFQDYENGGAPVSGGDTSSSGQPSSMALAVKDGIILAQEENKSKGQTGSGASQADADFDDLGSPRGWNASSLNRALNEGGGSGSGGGGGGNQPPFNLFNGQSPWGNIAGGLAGGSMASTRGGLMTALRNGGPFGQTAALALGVAGVAGDAISSMNDYIGQANDAGSDNAAGYDSMSQGMEMMGLNQAQADRANRTVHSDYNRLANGDPSGVIRIATGTRGLLSVSDIRDAAGDPTKLAETFRERAKARGWSDARIAGAAEMAGLDGFARVTHASDAAVNGARSTVEQRNTLDHSEDQARFRDANAQRAFASPDYMAPRWGLEEGSELARGAGSAMVGSFKTLEATRGGIHTAVAGSMDWLLNNVEQLESGGDPHAVSKSGAVGSMQTLRSTLRDPGFGVRPAQNDSPEEMRRVGRDYQVAMVTRYHGDLEKGAAAYTDGAGTVDAAVKKYGDDWLSHMPAQAQKRVADLHSLSSKGAGSFAGSPAATGAASAPTINVNINAKVNNQQATANVSASGGQTVNQTVNMNQGAQQRR